MRTFYLNFSRKQADQTAENVDTSGASVDSNTEPKDDTKNPPNAENPYKLQGQRSPWMDAGIGGGVGGLLGAALGYLYGHRGRWLAYDTLAGGLGGGTLGYVIGANSNSNIASKSSERPPAPKGSVVSKQQRMELRRKKEEEAWQKGKARHDEIMRNGGYATDLESSNGLLDAFLNFIRRGEAYRKGYNYDTKDRADAAKFDNYMDRVGSIDLDFPGAGRF